MNFLADESVEREIVEQLRQDGYSVQYVAEMSPGISDEDVLNLANHTGSLLVTGDKDFGELIYRQHRLNSGVILVRLDSLPPHIKAIIVASMIGKHTAELEQAFTVITPGTTRIRRSKYVDTLDMNE